VALYRTSSLAAHSGATVRDFHPLPFSPARGGENLGTVSIITTLDYCEQMKIAQLQDYFSSWQ
jgi:hypothetical protein